MVSKKSALTAALSGPPPSAQQLQQEGVKSDGFSCIAEGSAPLSIDHITEGFEKVDLRRMSLPGSAPSYLPKPGSLVVDYELNPYQPRGGKEVVPSSLKVGSASRNFLSEAVIGSLPKALSLSERQNIFASTPLSPTMNLLSSLPSDKVHSRTLEGKRLRRHVLRGAVLVFITAGYSGKRFIFEKAKELGVRSVVIDGPESWSQGMVEEGIVEKFIGLDMSDAETVFERCLEAIKKVKKEYGELDGVLSFSEMAMPLVARLTEQLGLPGNSPAAVDAARDKHATRGAMAAAGLPTPRNFLITEPDQLKQASDHVGYPAVIKPIYGAASIGVVRIDDYKQLQAAYAKVCKDLSSAKIVAGALQQGEEEEAAREGDQKGKASSWIKTTIMMEEYLDGPEVDVDLVFSEGLPVYGAVSDNMPTIEPYFNETGSNSPSILPAYQQRELLDLGVKSVQALGFLSGVFHVECKYTSRGARLIEVNCRMGGGPVRNMNLLVWGVDMVEEQLLCSAGIPSRPPVAPKPLCNVAEYSVNAMKTGILRDLSFLGKYQEDPDVLYARGIVQPGTKVVCAEDGLPTWVCEVMVSKKTVDEAIACVKAMEAEIQAAMVIDPLPRK